MALHSATGFSYSANASGAGWTDISGTSAIATVGRPGTGTRSLDLGSFDQARSPYADWDATTDTLMAQFAIQFHAGTASGNRVFASMGGQGGGVNTGGDNHFVTLTRNGDDDSISVWYSDGAGGTNSLVGTLATPMVIGQWYYMRIKYLPHPTTGLIEVQLDSEVFTFSGDTAHDTSFNAVTPAAIEFGVSNAMSLYIADCLVFDDAVSGNEITDWTTEEVVLEASRPDATVSNTMTITGGAGSVHASLDDLPEDTATRVESATIGHAARVSFPDLATVETPIAVVAAVYAAKDGAGARTLGFDVHSDGSTEAETIALSGAYGWTRQVLGEAPGGVAWTTAKVDDIEVSVDVDA